MLPLNLTGASRTNRPDPLSLAIYGFDGGWFCPKMVIAHKDGATDKKGGNFVLIFAV